jgi:hypothetical protein
MRPPGCAALLLALLSHGALGKLAVVESGISGVRFRYSPGRLTTAEDFGDLTTVDFEDADHLRELGEPDVPLKIVRIGLPQEGGFEIMVSTSPPLLLDGVNVPSVQSCGSAVNPSQLRSSARGRVPLTDQSGFWPPAVCEQEEVQQLRDVRMVELRLSPAQLDESTGRLRYYEWVEVDVRFHQLPVSTERTEPLDGVISRMLLNGSLACKWKTAGLNKDINWFARSTDWVKVKVAETGIHVVTGAQMEKLGVSLAGVDPKTLALYTLGEHQANGPYPDTMVPVAVRVSGEYDGRFDSQDMVVFYALGADHWVNRCSSYVRNLYTAENVYWLTWGGRPGLRMPRGLGPDTAGTRVVRFATSRVHLEQDLLCPARSGLLWLWESMTKGGEQQAVEAEVDLPLRYPGFINRISGQLFTDPNSADHRVEVRLNGVLLDTLRFGPTSPNAPFRFTLQPNQPARFEDNRLGLELSGDGWKKIYLDFLEVEHTRRLSLFNGQLGFLWQEPGTYRFCVRDLVQLEPGQEVYVLDVSNPLVPRMSDGIELHGDSFRFCRRVYGPTEFAVASSNQLVAPVSLESKRPGRLSSGSLVADYWIVAPREFHGAAERLAEMRRGRIPGIASARVEVADLEDVYDDYGFGVEEPGAIRQFFVDKRPSYGLLVGDVTYDYRNNLNRVRTPGVPPYETGRSMDPSGSSNREALAFDAWYADFDGQGGSPDMILGRVTARSGVELGRFIDKVETYESAPAEAWTKRYILLADDEYEGDPGRPDRIGFKHVEYAEAMSVLPGSHMDNVKVYLTEYPFAGTRNKPEARTELLRQLRRGALLLVFFGHGDAFDLAHESVLNITQVSDITNQHRSPFCFFGSCSVGRFEDTRYECIAEEMTRKPDGGAIAAIGATKATTAGTNIVFATNLLAPLFESPDSTIGSAFFYAWPTDRIYHLFGDPTMTLRMPIPSGRDVAVSPDTLRPGARFSAQTLLGSETGGRGEFAWTLFGPRRVRRYTSDRGTIDYTFPGLELGRGAGKMEHGRVFCRGTFPLGVPLDTVFVSNGFYAPISRSCRLSLIASDDTIDIGLVRDTIAFTSEPAVVTDSSGPRVVLTADGHVLEDGCTVPPSFELTGILSDPSGVLIADLPGVKSRLQVSGSGIECELRDMLSFEDSSGTKARFRLGIDLENRTDTIEVEAFDNVQNRTQLSVAVSRTDVRDALAMDSVCIYPNPVSRDAWVTFVSSMAATARVRFFSLSGRLVRDLGTVPVQFGYNQLYWDGRGCNGGQPGNGVYLCDVLLQSTAGDTGGAETVRARERFVVMH